MGDVPTDSSFLEFSPLHPYPGGYNTSKSPSQIGYWLGLAMAQNPNPFYEFASRFTSGLSEDPTQKMKNLSRALIQIPVGKETVPRLQMTVDFLWIPSRIWF